MAKYFLLFASISASLAFAAGPSITGISGVSNSTLSGTAIAYGGIAGTCSGDGSSPCNSCNAAGVQGCGATAPLCPCNTARIYDSLPISVALKPATADGHHACAAINTSGTRSLLNLLNAANGGTSVAFYWNQVCGGSCETTTTTSVQVDIWIDTAGTGCNAASPTDVTQLQFKIIAPGVLDYNVYGASTTEGIGDFQVYPGDTKVYIKDIQSSTSFPAMTYGGGTTIRSLRVFYAQDAIDNANYQGQSSPTDLSFDSGAKNLDRNIVDGLDNDTSYFFRIALVDDANNVVQYFPDANATDASGTAHADCVAGTANAATCPFAATPSQVLGLLSKDFNCFIATAAYGSTMEPKLETFRAFRENILARNPVGVQFIKFYYTYGPRAALYISDKPGLRAVTRAALWPVYGFTYLALKFGFAWTFALILVLSASLIALATRGMQRMWPR